MGVVLADQKRRVISRNKRGTTAYYVWLGAGLQTNNSKRNLMKHSEVLT